jgi:hypothetical protein
MSRALTFENFCQVKSAGSTAARGGGGRLLV